MGGCLGWQLRYGLLCGQVQLFPTVLVDETLLYGAELQRTLIYNSRGETFGTVS